MRHPFVTLIEAKGLKTSEILRYAQNDRGQRILNEG